VSKNFNYTPYYKELVGMYISNGGNITKACSDLIKEKNLDINPERLRRAFSKYLNKRGGGLNKNQDKFEKYCSEVGIDPSKVTNYWHKGKHYSIHTRPNQFSYDELRDEVIKQMQKYSPSYPVVKRTPTKDPHLLVIDPCDVHIGKLAKAMESGEEYNSEIAVQRVREGVQGILDKSSGFNIDKILFVAGNDILHIDTPNRRTTNGTPQDTDGMWYENFLKAKDLYVEIIEKLIQVADVHFVFNPSNHDYMSGFFLADTISSWFKNCKNVTFDVSISHRKYFPYHSNLIGTTHGDGAKHQDLPLLMAQEAKENWGLTKHKYIYTHHLHHKTSKEYMGVTVETMRSPSGTDSWHHKNGYQHAAKAIEGFIHHPSYGQISRITHIF
jgi:hypothetical protein